MVNFEIKGKAERVSKESIRAMLHATATVLEFHKFSTPHESIKVNITNSKKRLGKAPKSKSKNKQAWGKACSSDGWIMLYSKMDFEQMITVCIHEVIHIYLRFDDSEIECITSTLTGRLKPFIVPLYEVLAKNVYARAGVLAHRKMSYKNASDKDYYNPEQWKEVEVDKKAEEKHYSKRVDCPS